MEPKGDSRIFSQILNRKNADYGDTKPRILCFRVEIGTPYLPDRQTLTRFGKVDRLYDICASETAVDAIKSELPMHSFILRCAPVSCALWLP